MAFRAYWILMASLVTLGLAACGGSSTGPEGMPDDDMMMSVADDRDR